MTDSTIKSSLLALGLNELQAAEAAEAAASDAFHDSNLSSDREAWLAAFNRAQELRRLYKLGDALILSRGF
jgi:hypothetical protein